MDPRAPVPRDGPRDGGVRTYLADERLRLNDEARIQLGAMSVPVLLHADDAHERLFVAALDGTGLDFFRDPDHASSVGKTFGEIRRVGDPQIRAAYVAGPGTQDNPFARLADSVIGYSVDERAESMYQLFIDRAGPWAREDPGARISVAGLGFSRGAEEVALFQRLVEERGIQDPNGAIYKRDMSGNIQGVEYTRPALVTPGHVAQVAVLFDPVGTGVAMDMDRRLPPSVISGLQLTALDDRRKLFRSDHIIDPGATPDGRFVGLDLVGSHSDIGGGYPRDGLADQARNMAVAYLDALSERPFLAPVAESANPVDNVIHRSEDGSLLYGIDYKVDRREPGGYNELLVGDRIAAQVPDPRNAEPRDEALAAQFQWRQIGAVSLEPALQVAPTVRTTATALDRLIDELYQAALRGDAKAMDGVAEDYLRTSPGMAWQGRVDDALVVPLAAPELPRLEPAAPDALRHAVVM